MDEAVSHASHKQPGNLWVRFLDVCWYLISRFPNNDKIQLNCPNRSDIRPKYLKILIVGKRLDLCDGVQYILHACYPTLRRQE